MADIDRRPPDSPLVYDTAPHERVSVGVVRAVSAVTGLAPYPSTPPTEYLDPLSTVVDPDALDTLFGVSPAGCSHFSGSVTFCYHDCTVTVDDAGRVTVERRSEAPSRTDDL